MYRGMPGQYIYGECIITQSPSRLPYCIFEKGGWNLAKPKKFIFKARLRVWTR